MIIKEYGFVINEKIEMLFSIDASVILLSILMTYLEMRAFL